MVSIESGINRRTEVYLPKGKEASVIDGSDH